MLKIILVFKICLAKPQIPQGPEEIVRIKYWFRGQVFD
jgi:hypothetical protein